MLFRNRPQELVAHRRGLVDRVGREAERAPADPVRLEIDAGHDVPLRHVLARS